MGLLDWLAIKAHPPVRNPVEHQAPELRALTEPIYRQGGIRQGIVSTGQQPTTSRLLTEGFRSTQATASRAISSRLSDLEFRMQRREIVEGEPRWVDDLLHPFLSVLERPNPLLSRRQMLKLASYWLTQSGECFWLIVTNGVGATRELWPLGPQLVEKLSDNDSPVSGFVFHSETGEIRYSLEEVVWIYDPDPADPFQGVGIVGPQAVDFDSSTFASQTMRSHYQHDASPKVVLKGGEGAVTPDAKQKAAFAADWQNRFNKRGGENNGVPAFIPTDWDVQELTGGGGVTDSVALLSYLRDGLLMANGVPRSILGDVVDANRAAADTNRLVFDRHTITPQAGLIADALTHQLVVPEFGNDWRVCFEDFVDEDEELRLSEERQDLELKVRTVNQVRADRGLDPVDWGEVPIGTFGDQPYEPEAFDDDDDPDPFGTDPGGEAEPEPPSTQEDTEPRQRVVSPRIAARFTSEATWARMIQAETTFVPKMISRLRRVFAAQKALTLDAMKDSPLSERSHERADWIDELFELADFSRLFDVLVTPITVEVYQKSGENVLAALEQRPSLSFDEIAVKEIREQGAELVTFANATTKRNLRSTLAKGVEAGESFEDLAKRVRRTFNAASKSRARTIARTEVGHAITKGQLAGYRESKVVTLKRWNTALDDRVRDSHEIDGQTVRVDEPFILGDGEPAQGPRVGTDGGRLSAHNSINCRCFTTPVLEGV
jgi:SPP1 gp7 family putative phage head morphogenesis protein